jgi:hypothetical protein
LASPLIPKNSQKSKPRARRARQASNQVSRFSPNITLNHTFRWQDVRAANAGTIVTGLAPSMLCAASGFLGTSAVNIFPSFAAVRIKAIRMAAVLPEGASYTSGNAYLSVEFTRTVNGLSLVGFGSREFSVPIVSPTNLTRLIVRPSKEWLAGNWVSASDASTFMYIRTSPGTMIELDLECNISDGVPASTYGCVAGTLDSQGFSYLDLATAAGSRVLRPYGAFVQFA